MLLIKVLYEIKVNGDLGFLKDLMRDEQVKSVISGVCKRHKCKVDEVKELLRDYTLKNYRFDEDFTEERYLNGLRKYLGRKIREQNGKNK